MKSFLVRIGLWVFLPLCLMAWMADTPKLFLVGDSISIQYGPYLERYLQGAVQFSRKQDDGGSRDDRVSNGANGGDSRMVLAYLNAKVKDRGFKPDVLMLNCGLHDIKKDVKTLRNQVSIQDYERNLEAIIKLLDENDIRLIWIRTTQVVDSIHNAKAPRDFTRHAADEQAYNAVADKVFRKANVRVIDLYEFTKSLSDNRFIDHVHYNEETRKLQGAYIAGWVKAWLGQPGAGKNVRR